MARLHWDEEGGLPRRCEGDFTQGVWLRRAQSLREISDQVGWVLDADRQPDRRVENPYFLTDVGRNAGVRHACGQAGKRLDAAQAHG